MAKALLLSLLLLGSAACDRSPAPPAQIRAADATGCLGRPAAASPDDKALIAALDSSNETAPLPALVGRVLDEAKLVSAAGEQRLDARLAALERATSDQLVVVTLTSLGGAPIEQVGLRYGNDWKIGRADFDNGVLLIVAPNERKARIEVGCGLEGLLTDQKAQHIMDEQLVPRFRAGRYEDGIEAGVAAIDAALRSDRRRPQPRPKAGA